MTSKSTENDSNNGAAQARRNVADPDAGLIFWTPKPGDNKARDKALNWARTKGTIQGLVGLGIGTLIYLYWSQVVGYISWGISSFVLFSALVSPGGLYHGINKFFSGLGVLFARIATPFVLVPNFFFVFSPLGMLLRRGKNDKLARKLEKGNETYWCDRERNDDGLTSYERQF